MSILRKKVFLGAPVKCFSLYGSNNSDSVVFRNVGFTEIKDHSLSTIDFLKTFLSRYNLRKKVFGKVNKSGSSWYWVFFEYPEYPKYLFPNIQLKTMCLFQSNTYALNPKWLCTEYICIETFKL